MVMCSGWWWVLYSVKVLLFKRIIDIYNQNNTAVLYCYKVLLFSKMASIQLLLFSMLNHDTTFWSVTHVIKDHEQTDFLGYTRLL